MGTATEMIGASLQSAGDELFVQSAEGITAKQKASPGINEQNNNEKVRKVTQPSTSKSYEMLWTVLVPTTQEMNQEKD